MVVAADMRDTDAAAAMDAGSRVLKVIPTHFFQQTRGDTSHVRGTLCVNVVIASETVHPKVDSFPAKDSPTDPPLILLIGRF